MNGFTQNSVYYTKGFKCYFVKEKNTTSRLDVQQFVTWVLLSWIAEYLFMSLPPTSTPLKQCQTILSIGFYEISNWLFQQEITNNDFFILSLRSFHILKMKIHSDFEP